jgi:undecaprenyl-diphosphatase
MIKQGWLDAKPSDLFNVVIQSGAVLAVLAVFTRRVRSFFLEWRSPDIQDYLKKLLVCFVITGVGGLVLKFTGFAELPEEAMPVAIALLVGGIGFVAIEMWLKKRPTSHSITWTVAIAVAIGQLVAAVFPGASRSGTTILIALMLGVSRPAATEFSFIVGIPTLLAAGLLETTLSILKGEPHEPWILIFFGSVVAAVSAFLVVRWLLGYIRSHTFEAFGWYRIGLGVLLLALLR